MEKNEITTVDKELTEVLKEEYGMEITPYEGDLQRTGKTLIPVPEDLAAELSVVTSALPTIAANSAAGEALSKTAYSITFNGKDVLPGELWQKKNGSFISNLNAHVR